MTADEGEKRCPNCAPGYDCERGIYTPDPAVAVVEVVREWRHGRVSGIDLQAAVDQYEAGD